MSPLSRHTLVAAAVAVLSGCALVFPPHSPPISDRPAPRDASPVSPVTPPPAAKPISFALDTSSWGTPKPAAERIGRVGEEGDGAPAAKKPTIKVVPAANPNTPAAVARPSRLGEKYPVIYRTLDGRFAGFSVTDSRGASEGVYYFNGQGELIGMLLPSRKGNSFPAAFTNATGELMGFAEADKRGTSFGWTLTDAKGKAIGYGVPDKRGASEGIHYSGRHPLLDFGPAKP